MKLPVVSAFSVLGFLGGVGADDPDPLGGLGGLMGGETNCPVFSCPAGEVAMQKPWEGSGEKKSHWPFVYGCDPQSFDMMMMLDPSQLQNGMPKKGGNAEKLSKCCRNRDIAQQICGMTKADLEASWKSCTTKKCKGDKSCEMSAGFGIMMSGGLTGDKCQEYNDFQKANCMCVPEKEEEGSFLETVKNFYGVFAKEKLPESGEVNEEWLGTTVYSSFKKTEKIKIWKALLEKYSAKLELKTRPKPDFGAGLGGKKDTAKKPEIKEEEEEMVEEVEETEL